jgi:energy-coupling factor transport system ATP-binding protein
MQYPEYQLFDETVKSDIGFGPRNLGLDAEEVERRVMEAVEFTGIDVSLLDKSPFELSGGQKRRVAIAGVLAMSPDILILDEPTAGLDPAGRNDILSCIKRLHSQKGITVILVSHSMEDIANFAHKIMIVSDAKLVSFGTPDSIFKDSQMLKNIGLNVPQVTRVVNHLKQKGIDLGDNIYTVEAALDAILNYVKEDAK